jgi:hypothetical protein
VPSSSAPLATLLADLGRALTDLGVRWYLFGAQAAILYGVARLTADVDITIDLESRSTAELTATLAAAGFEVRIPDAVAFAERTRVLPCVHLRTRIPIDIVLAGPGLEDLFFARVRELSIGQVRVPVASAEDLIVMKVLAARPKDLDDVVAMIRAHGPALDVEQIRQTLRTLERDLNRSDLVVELERALMRAGG